MNSRVGSQQRFEMALSAKQIGGVVVIALAALGGAFLLGASAERGTPHAGAAAPGQTDALAHLDEPMTAHEEAPPELKAHEALTDRRAIDKTLPVPAVQAPAQVAAAAVYDDKNADTLAPPPVVVQAPASQSAPKAAPAPAAPLAAVPAPSAAPAAAEPGEVLLPEEPPVKQPARKEPAKEASRARGRFTIQVGAVPHRGDAERLAKRFSSKNPHVVPADVPGRGRWYRVQIGSFETQDQARRQLSSLSASGVQGIVVATR